MVVGVVLAAAGAGLLGVTPAYAVGGTANVPNDAYGFAARIDVSGVRACSGALVAPQWIVTSAVCFAEPGRPVTAGAPPRAASVTVGRVVSAAKPLAVTKIVPHAERDIVLAKLQSRVTGVTPVPIAKSVPTIGEVLRAAGFGRTKTQWLPDELHVAAFAVRGVRVNALDLTRQDAAAGICKGDAGGPLMREAAGRVELVAIHRSAGQSGCLGSSDAGKDAVDTRLDDVAGWITQTTAHPTENVRAFYGYDGARTSLFTFTGSPVAPAQSWDSGPNSWSGARVKAVEGDFDGDGTQDVAAFYNYDNAQTKLWLFSAADGKTGSKLAWDSGRGNWDWSKADYVAGDFDGDGRDEIAGFYDYGNAQTKLFVFDDIAATVTRRMTWDSTASKWDANRAKLVAGDVDGDGKAEIAAFYNNDHAQTKTYLFADVTDKPTPAQVWDSGRGNWDWSKADYAAADFDADGRTEIAGFHQYADAQTKLFVFDDIAGRITRRMTWDSTAKAWDGSRAKIVAGDVDGDGKAEIAAFYNNDNAQTKLFLFTNVTDQPARRMAWDSGQNNWDWTRIRLTTGS
ncbi:trypsin-like serine protease [Couchioplanes azureus]|uniref:trypsin-like serine protease n=1 Tax=Couchioplanes caeruleus TaxID=56438 RepID=UPI001993A7A7|nr:trypsin-like serine protease [Couchioplanes caeruleus]GGQ77476.1 esterase [Couchioplanes caeruleus subsp. azureus]